MSYYAVQNNGGRPSRDSNPYAWARTMQKLGIVKVWRYRFGDSSAIHAPMEYFEQALTVFRADRTPQLYLTTMGNLALHHLDRGTWLKALDCYRKSVTVVEQVSDPFLFHQSRMNHYQEASLIFQAAAACAVKLDRPELAFSLIERGRLREWRRFQPWFIHLRDQLEHHHPALLKRWNKAAARSVHLASREKQSKNLEPLEWQHLVHQTKGTREELDRIKAEIIEVMGFDPTTLSPDYESFKAALTPGMSMVYLLTLEQWCIAVIYLRCGDQVSVKSLWEPKIPHWKPKKPLGSFNDEGFANSKKLTETILEAGPSFIEPNLLAKLYAFLIGVDTRHLVIVPLGLPSSFPLIHCMPFKVDGRTTTLWERFPISYAPSATLLVESLKSKAKQDLAAPFVLAVGNPTNSGNVLPMALLEAVKIGINFPDVPCRILSGSKATKENFLADLPAANYLHVGCNGLVNYADPWKSKLILTDGEPLDLVSLMNQPYLKNNPLIVLSSCWGSSSGSFYFNEEENISLATCFIQMGATGVMAPYGQIDDLATFFLIDRFYQLLLAEPKGGKTPISVAEALRQAAFWLRDVTVDVLWDYINDLEAASLAKSKDPAIEEEKNQAFDAARGGLVLLVDDLPFEHPYYWSQFRLTGV